MCVVCCCSTLWLIKLIGTPRGAETTRTTLPPAMPLTPLPLCMMCRAFPRQASVLQRARWLSFRGGVTRCCSGTCTPMVPTWTGPPCTPAAPPSRCVACASAPTHTASTVRRGCRFSAAGVTQQPCCLRAAAGHQVDRDQVDPQQAVRAWLRPPQDGSTVCRHGRQLQVSDCGGTTGSGRGMSRWEAASQRATPAAACWQPGMHTRHAPC